MAMFEICSFMFIPLFALLSFWVQHAAILQGMMAKELRSMFCRMETWCALKMIELHFLEFAGLSHLVFSFFRRILFENHDVSCCVRWQADGVTFERTLLRGLVRGKLDRKFRGVTTTTCFSDNQGNVKIFSRKMDDMTYKCSIPWVIQVVFLIFLAGTWTNICYTNELVIHRGFLTCWRYTYYILL